MRFKIKQRFATVIPFELLGYMMWNRIQHNLHLNVMPRIFFKEILCENIHIYIQHTIIWYMFWNSHCLRSDQWHYMHIYLVFIKMIRHIDLYRQVKLETVKGRGINRLGSRPSWYPQYELTNRSRTRFFLLFTWRSKCKEMKTKNLFWVARKSHSYQIWNDEMKPSFDCK